MREVWVVESQSEFEPEPWVCEAHITKVAAQNRKRVMSLQFPVKFVVTRYVPAPTKKSKAKAKKGTK